MSIKFGEAVGAALALVAVAVVAYAAVVQGSEMALGAVVAVVVGANSFFLRARVQAPK